MNESPTPETMDPGALPASVDEASETGAQRRRVIIVGAGQTGRQLAQILRDTWDICVLDPSEEKLTKLRDEAANKSVKTFVKDGTSLLNLKEAGLEGAEWLVACTDFDEANTEACRLALSIQNPPTALGVVRRPEAAAQLKETGAETLVRPGALAGLIKNRIEAAYQIASGVGIGQGEIIEIPVLRSSPAADARVRDLRARRWLVAAIYREGRYVVPHGHVIIRQGDRLLLTGEPSLLPHIADFLRAGVARFPLQFGMLTLAYPRHAEHTDFWPETEYFFNSTRSRALQMLTYDGEEAPSLKLTRGESSAKTVDKRDSLLRLASRDVPGLDCGLFVIPKPSISLLERAGLRQPEFAGALDALDCPLLMVNGSYPYRRIILPVMDRDASLLAAELAIDISRQLKVELAAVLVSAPAFIVGHETIEEQRKTLNAVMEVGALYHTKIQKIEREGNPPKVIAGLVGEGDLLVISHRIRRGSSFFNPDTSLQIAMRCQSSVLAISYRERIHAGS